MCVCVCVCVCVCTVSGEKVPGKAVIITTGTFLRGEIHIGESTVQHVIGRVMIQVTILQVWKALQLDVRVISQQLDLHKH